MITAFLFDFNGTLIRSPAWIALEVRDLPRAAFAHLAKEGHISLLNEAQLATAESVFREKRAEAEASLRETGHVEDLTAMVEVLDLQMDVSPDLIAQTVSTLHRRCIPTVELMPHTQEMLNRLQAIGLRLGIVSNAAYPPFLRWTLERFGILEYFEDIVVSADVAARKPGLDIFRIALKRLGLVPTAVAYVGDDFVKDVKASKQMDMRAVWYRPDGNVATPDDNTAPDATVTGHEQIPPLAEQWLANA